MILTGRRMNGVEAAQVGLVNYVVDQNSSEDAAYRQALNIAHTITEKVHTNFVQFSRNARPRNCPFSE